MPFVLEPFLLINQTQFKLFRLIAVLSSGTHAWWKSCDKNVKLKIAGNEICKYSQAKTNKQTKTKNRYKMYHPCPCWPVSSSHITGSWPHTLLRPSSGCHFGPLLPKWNLLMSQASSVLHSGGFSIKMREKQKARWNQPNYLCSHRNAHDKWTPTFSFRMTTWALNRGVIFLCVSMRKNVAFFSIKWSTTALAKYLRA